MIMWSAVILRIFENGSTRSPGQGSTTGCSTGPTDGSGERGAVPPGAVTGIGTPRSIKPRMSCFVTRPAYPVPGMVVMSTWCSAAILRTSGVDLRRRRSSAVSAPSPFGATGEDGEGWERTGEVAVGAGAGFGAAGWGGAGEAAAAGARWAAAEGPAVDAALLSVSMTATSVWTGTV